MRCTRAEVVCKGAHCGAGFRGLAQKRPCHTWPGVECTDMVACARPAPHAQLGPIPPSGRKVLHAYLALDSDTAYALEATMGSGHMHEAEDHRWQQQQQQEEDGSEDTPRTGGAAAANRRVGCGRASVRVRGVGM